jgi:Ni2+-binding GTPase involved in maturation of urease and hydrogenase
MASDARMLNPNAIVIKSSLKTEKGVDEIINVIENFMNG